MTHVRHKVPNMKISIEASHKEEECASELECPSTTMLPLYNFNLTNLLMVLWLKGTKLVTNSLSGVKKWLFYKILLDSIMVNWSLSAWMFLSSVRPSKSTWAMHKMVALGDS